ncbi:Helicase associated domain protein [Streptomyces sp. NPDC021093]|uniref:DEAD/DEAH box helicase n=1 Tax=Streptomyces sp. NPDC021093 TaxID=3365112 RepID=UPI0037B3298E
MQVVKGLVMSGNPLFPHQKEAVDAVLRALQVPADGVMPSEGLRTQVIAATATGKTRIAAAVAQQLRALRVLVLVPSLDLLVQTAKAWRAAGRTGAMVGACSLPASKSEGVPCTTDAAELAGWVHSLDQVTVLATYHSLGNGVLEQAHKLGIGPWSLIIVDEAHRTSGDGLKPWAAVHDQARIPAERRVYMTATPRVWETTQDAQRAGRTAPRLVASMEPDSSIFGPVCFELPLSEAVSKGLVAPFQVVVVNVDGPELRIALEEAESGSDALRGARLAALQTGLVKAAAKHQMRKVLTFHSRTADAEAMAGGLVDVARRLWEDDPEMFHAPERVWVDWLYGDHDPGHRRAVLEEFGADVIEDEKGMHPAALRVVSSVRVIAEGVDTVNCDSVAFCDTRGSMVDIVQVVGRALRLRPGKEKLASLVVFVFTPEGENSEGKLSSRGHEPLAKILSALRAYDSRVVEALADPRVRSGSWEETEADEADGADAEGEEQEQQGRDGPAVSAPTREVLRFAEPWDPAELARFVRLRVIEPENEYWRRGIEASVQYRAEVGGDELLVPYAFVTPEDWTPAGYPLGVWHADQRRYYRAGKLDGARVAELDELGMVWNPLERTEAFEGWLECARSWTEVHGHFLPPAGAVWEGRQLGAWAKNMRKAAKTADTLTERREAGLPVGSEAGALSEGRRDALDEIDPGWYPAWNSGWQRRLRLTQQHLKDGGAVPTRPGELVVQGEDLGKWVQACRLGWDELTLVQHYLLEHALGLEPATEDERPVKRTQGDKWMLNLRAARAFHAREGHLNVPRKHVEQLEPHDGPGGAQNGADREGVSVKLGMVLDNIRKRAGKLTDERWAALDQLGMRWAAGTTRRNTQ